MNPNQNRVSFINPSATLNIVEGQSMVVATTSQTLPDGTTRDTPVVYTGEELNQQLTLAQAIVTKIQAAIELIPTN